MTINRLLLTGGGACAKGLDASLAARLNMPVLTCRPSALLHCNGTFHDLAQSPLLVQSIGLAKWGR
ncbi:MAG TPA: hypothetical protein VF669_07525 [Tepidisphaeraceae bacterium]|jgi:Tfp pilus assembly PilM family ATPase